MSLSHIQSTIVKWNNQFPIDYWYRKTYNIAFNSIEHRRISIIDMKIEYEERKLMEKYHQEKEEREKDLQYFHATGELLKPPTEQEYTEKDVEDWYDNINIDELNRNNSKQK